MAEVNALREAALRYYKQSWVCHPLRNNDEGLPKVAIVKEWEKLTLSPEIGALPWSKAVGLGILLGAPSGNLGVIDIDDEGLAADAFAWYVRSHKQPLMAYTARRRIHVYCIEPEPSRTRKLQLVYQGRPVLVEQRSEGAYVAAPPSPGYQWANEQWEPLYASLDAAMTELRQALGLTWQNPLQQGAVATGTAGYPTDWATSVGQGERNDACFYEASCLKDARMPKEAAWAFMEQRIRTAYVPPINWRELRRTFDSAFSRPRSERASAEERGKKWTFDVTR